MVCYIISYDLISKRDYEKLYEAIKSYANWARINDSVWAVISDESAETIRDKFLKHIDSDDRLFVIKSGLEAAWRNARCSNKWLKDNL